MVAPVRKYFKRISPAMRAMLLVNSRVLDLSINDFYKIIVALDEFAVHLFECA